MTTFPLVLGTAAVGVLQVHRRQPAPLTPRQRRDGRVFAHLGLGLLLLSATTEAALDIRDDLLAGELQARWSRGDQAIGMVAVQLDSGMGEACLRLRAIACVQGRRLSDTAADVITGHLRYHPEHTADSAGESDTIMQTRRQLVAGCCRRVNESSARTRTA